MFSQKAHRIRSFILWLALLAGVALGLAWATTPARAAQTSDLCGEGSAPDYGFDYALQQPHWTVNWEDYVSEETVTEVDVILDELEADSIAQTMILFKPQAEVGTRVNCAVHFLRYMRLGLPSGERKDNGFAFLIVVEDGEIDVHYGVGLGLPALTAHDLTDLNRQAEQTYQDSGSLDQALLMLVQEYDTYARSKYAPYRTPAPTPISIDLPKLPAGPVGILVLCCLLCLAMLVLLFVLWVLIQLSRLGRFFRPMSGPSFPRTRFPGGGGGFPRTRFPGGGGGGFRTRGGGGSGRSGRGN